MAIIIISLEIIYNFGTFIITHTQSFIIYQLFTTTYTYHTFYNNYLLLLFVIILNEALLTQQVLIF